VELVRAFAAEPRVLLVDEPFAGLDPLAVESVAAHLRGLAAGGLGVLLTDHDVRQALEVCARVYILTAGRVLRAGDSATIRRDPVAQARYLGTTFDSPPDPTGSTTADDVGRARAPQRVD